MTFLAVQSDTILGWLDGDGQLVGVITHSTYESADGYSGRPTLPPEGAPIVAMSVAGVTRRGAKTTIGFLYAPVGAGTELAARDENGAPTTPSRWL